MSFLYTAHRLVLFYISSKYHRTIPKGIRVTERTQNLFQIKQRVITPKVRKAELSFLYATRRLVLFYIPSKYHRNIPKGYLSYRADTKSFSNKTKGDNSKSKKGKVVILVRDTSSGPVLHFFHRNIPKGIRVTERTQNLFQIKQRVITPKVRKAELSFLYATRRLVLFYISTKYHQNIPRDIQVTERTRSFTPTQTLTLTPTPTPTPTPKGSVPKTICTPLTFARGGGT